MFKNIPSRLTNSGLNLFKTESLHRVKRLQIAFPLNKCTTDSDCSNIEGVSRDLVRCDESTGVCDCNECFSRINDTCQVYQPNCTGYSQEEGKCVDNRKSQKVGLILSIFFGSVGGANFYIEQNLIGMNYVVVIVCVKLTSKGSPTHVMLMRFVL